MPRGVALVVCFVGFAPVAAAVGPAPGRSPTTQPASAPATSTSRPITPEGALWREIQQLTQDSPPAETGDSSAEHGDWFEHAAARRRELVDRLRLYVQLYPGGEHAADAVRLELQSLFELGTLGGGDFDPLRARVDQLLREYAENTPIRWEAAYWQIQCEAIERHAENPPATQDVHTPDEVRLAAYRRYVAEYPRSPYVPYMYVQLYDNAARDNRAARMRQILAALQEAFPDHSVTRWLAARWRRRQAVGQLFWLAEDLPAGGRVDTRTGVGRPVLIVVWCSDHAPSTHALRAVNEFCAQHPQVRPFGVNVDLDVADMQRTVTRLGLDWPQYNDGLGLANRFVRQWGVREIPFVFAVDDRGRLVGAAGLAGWRRLAQDALTADAYNN